MSRDIRWMGRLANLSTPYRQVTHMKDGTANHIIIRVGPGRGAPGARLGVGYTKKGMGLTDNATLSHDYNYSKRKKMMSAGIILICYQGDAFSPNAHTRVFTSFSEIIQFVRYPAVPKLPSPEANWNMGTGC